MKLGMPYRTALKMSDFGSADKVMTQNVWEQVGSYTVPAGHAIALGYGGLVGQDSANGRIYFDPNTIVPADIAGSVRIAVHNARDEFVRILFEARTEQLRTSATDRQQQLPFPLIPMRVWQDWKIIVYIRNDVAGETFDISASVLLADSTIWPLV